LPRAACRRPPPALAAGLAPAAARVSAGPPPTARRAFLLRIAVALLLGAATVFSFAPFYLWPLPLVTLGGLAWLLLRAPSPRACFVLGYAFGFGWFATGVSWVFVS